MFYTTQNVGFSHLVYGNLLEALEKRPLSILAIS
jgi:hypothetical protein